MTRISVISLLLFEELVIFQDGKHLCPKKRDGCCNVLYQLATNHFKTCNSVVDSKSEFASLLILHQNIVHKICRAYCPIQEDRDDLFQEIALQLWRAYPTFRSEAKESTWIYRVALNVAISNVRRKKRQHEQVTVALNQLPDISDLPDGDEKIEALYQAIYTLSTLEKALILLYFENKSLEEIAILTGATVGNIRVKMHRIREKIRTQIQRTTSP